MAIRGGGFGGLGEKGKEIKQKNKKKNLIHTDNTMVIIKENRGGGS